MREYADLLMKKKHFPEALDILYLAKERGKYGFFDIHFFHILFFFFL